MKRSILLLAIAASFAAHAQRAPSPTAQLDCKPAQEDLAYDCKLRLERRDGTPLPDVKVSVGADMPSMPMAHNVRPVAATPAAAPGEYGVRLELEMHGEWAVKLRLSGAVNDLLVLHYRFEPDAARPVKPARRGSRSTP